ncbi:hypothetical protein [Streptomyces sp. NBC_01176]|uniref:hypothetical protein n=1 Tax=Streptomyces sp. NBC_01176 TaxID=2903760 RepID=UPI002F90C07E|nr:hypothetical protein OG199_44935 [Streptomyces sp. NBC_01176]
MADDRVFAAEPDSVVRGGDVTDRISQILERLSHGYADETSWDAGNPPWGVGQLGTVFAKQYVPPHSELRDAVSALAAAMLGAATKTLTSGRSFSGAQDHAVHEIESKGRR